MPSTNRYEPKRRPPALAKLLLLAAVACAAIAVLPGVALASVAKGTGMGLVYVAAPGETNNVTIALGAGSYTITDTSATITPQAGCSGGGSTVTCPDTGIVLVRVNLRDGDDTLDASSLTVDLVASGGTGDDTIKGGSGRNTLAAQSGTVGGSQTLTSAGTTGFDKLVGASTKDTIKGDGVLKGSGGNDTITATGASTVKGGAGDDTINASGAIDALYGDGGNDTIYAANGVTDEIRCGGGGGTAYIDWLDPPTNTQPGDMTQNCTLV